MARPALRLAALKPAAGSAEDQYAQIVCAKNDLHDSPSGGFGPNGHCGAVPWASVSRIPELRERILLRRLGTELYENYDSSRETRHGRL